MSKWRNAKRETFIDSPGERVLIAFFVGVSLTIFLHSLIDGDQGAHQTIESFRSCESEDASGPCVWDAQVQGNGHGESFVVDRFGNVAYLGGGDNE